MQEKMAKQISWIIASCFRAEECLRNGAGVMGEIRPLVRAGGHGDE